ncbi:phytanoyl- dioxygenase superfamily protein [Achlya hypogyna]|uniref:Ribokinase n=1 Tax=Achlya hypogyna TaxID=1202772 RepID=A0A1V9ZAX8_ACHHY|nr:phytanoyl- dioxygenase superfamily protein [Achlya hypogyna]
MLSAEQVGEFLDTGVVVVDNVLSTSEIAAAREALHDELRASGVDHDNLAATAPNLKKLSSTGGAGGILDLFYPSWRLSVAEHPRVFQAISELWAASYATGTNELFQHPFGPLNPSEGYIYINRVCYRIPDAISASSHEGSSRKNSKKQLQRSLTPHVDCCPTNLYETGKEFPRWRPIQCITVLTDNLEPSTGGFEAVRGFHKEFASYFAKASDADLDARKPVCLGDFSPLRMQEDRDVISRFRHVPAPAGSVIMFDWRIPHANSYRHVGSIPREVIYTGFLPRVPINQAYAQEQLRRYEARLLPADHWQKSNTGPGKVDERFSPHEFSPLGRRLMAMDAATSSRCLIGGKGANQAVAAARTGAPTAFLGQFGDDYAGRMQSHLAEAGVAIDASSKVHSDVVSGQATIFLMPSGENAIVIVPGANAAWPPALTEGMKDSIRQAKVVLLQCEIPHEVNRMVAIEAKAAGATVIWDVGGEERPLDKDFLQYVDYMCPNETELQRCLGTSAPLESLDQIVDAAKALQDQYHRPALLISRGSKGSVLVSKDGSITEQGVFPATVVDTTGAGDCFRGAFAATLAQGKSIRECLEYAAASSALCVGLLGATMPTHDATLAFLAEPHA